MITLLQAIVLGVVQGLAEFLPISSSAHLILIPYFCKWDDPGLAFDVALHMGTLVAILAYFRTDWLDLAKQVFQPKYKNPTSISWKLLVAGTIPGAVAGYLLEKQAEELFRSPIMIAVTLAVFGLLLGFWDLRGRKSRGLAQFSMKDALLVGSAQALAILPGVSRSGITITVALFLGFTRPAAMRFSFLLSAPIIAGAGILKFRHIFHELSQGGQVALNFGAGFVASLIAGMGALVILDWLVRNRTLRPFVYYRLALSFVVIVFAVVQ